ncbi:MAG TPA: SIMPL domain-containing protein [Methanocella sp.]|jgi:hypothetical protein
MGFKKGFLFVCGALFALAAIFLIIGNTTAQNTPSKINMSEYCGTLTVTGSGDVYAEPDLAKVTIGVTTEATTSTAAMGDNANAMSKVIDAIKRLGIPEKDIKTSTVSLQPKYEYQYPTAASSPTGTDKVVPPVPTSSPPTSLSTRIVGYTATNTVTVTVRDMSLVGKVIDEGYSGGANKINGVSFLLSDEKGATVYKDALKKAVAEAKDKAGVLATAAGISDYRLKTVSENGQYYPMAYDAMERTAAVGMAASAPTPISPGQNKVTATVGLTYVYVPQ